MGKSKHMSKEQILAAQAVTRSNRQAARRLMVSYDTYSKYAKLYEAEPGVTLFEKHLATSAGIPRYSTRKDKSIPIKGILDGTVDGTLWPVSDIKNRMIHDAILIEKCASCGYKEQRIGDFKIPLLLSFVDGNQKNFLKGNLQMLCYNCYFLQVGDIFSIRDHEHIEGHIPLSEVSEEANFEVDDFMLKRFKELGISDEEDDDPDGLNELISRQ